MEIGSNTNQRVRRTSGEPSYFSMMPHIADDDLDVYEYRLYGHYKRVGTCWESVRTTAEKTKMSMGKVSATRDQLEHKGYITVEKRENNTYIIEVVNRWDENHSRYCSPHEHDCSPDERGCSPHETKNTYIKKTKEEDSPFVPSDWQSAWEAQTGLPFPIGQLEHSNDLEVRYEMSREVFLEALESCWKNKRGRSITAGYVIATFDGMMADRIAEQAEKKQATAPKVVNI